TKPRDPDICLSVSALVNCHKEGEHSAGESMHRILVDLGFWSTPRRNRTCPYGIPRSIVADQRPALVDPGIRLGVQTDRTTITVWNGLEGSFTCVSSLQEPTL